jgi:hypothetical protein
MNELVDVNLYISHEEEMSLRDKKILQFRSEKNL